MLHLLRPHRQQQLSSVEEATIDTEAKATQALGSVMAAVPRHKQDLTLLEALDKSLDAAKRTATKKLSNSSAAGGAITAEIAQLQLLLQPQVNA